MCLGMEWNPSDDGLSVVTVEEADVLTSENDLLQLQNINSIEDSDEFRTDLFSRQLIF